MTKQKIIFSILLTLIVLTSSLVFIFNNEYFRVDIQNTNTKYYVNETGDWDLSATEYVRIFDGTTLMRAKSRNITWFNDSENVYAVRNSEFKDNISLVQTYIFDINENQIENVPISNEVECINCEGKIVEYLVQDILYEGETKNIVSPFSFGHKMRVEWKDNTDFQWGKVYQQKTASDKIVIRFKPNEEIENYFVRLYDPISEILYTGFDFDTAVSGNGAPMGITTNNTYIWITDEADTGIYEYYMNGTYTGDFFNTSSDGITPTGITSNSNYVWVSDEITDEVYQYYITNPISMVINSPINTTYYDSNNMTFNITVSPIIPISTCLLSLDSANNVTMTNTTGNHWNYTNSSMTIGSHEVQFFCNNTNGESEYLTEYFTIGNHVTLNSPTDDYINEFSTITFNGTILIDNEIYNSSLWTNKTGTWTSNNITQYSQIYDEINDSSVNTSLWNTSTSKSGTGYSPTIVEDVNVITLSATMDVSAGGTTSETLVSNNFISDVSLIDTLNISVSVGIGCKSYSGGSAGFSIFGNKIKSYSDCGQGDDSVWTFVNNMSTGSIQFDVYNDSVYAYTITPSNNQLYFTASQTMASSSLYSAGGVVLRYVYLNYTNPVNTTFINTINGSTLWNIQTCNSIGECFFANENFTTDYDRFSSLVSINYPTNTTYFQDITQLNYTVIDNYPSQCWYSNNSGVTNNSVQTSGNNFTINAPFGTNTYIVYCNDTNGNIGSDSVTFNKTHLYFTPNSTNNTLNANFNTQDWIYTSVDTYNTNRSNITFNLYTDGGYFNNRTFTNLTNVYNFTGLSSNFYFFNVTVCYNDSSGCFSTEERYYGNQSINFTINNQKNDLNVELGTPINLTVRTNVGNMSFDIDHPEYGNNQNISFLNSTLSLLINYFRNNLFYVEDTQTNSTMSTTRFDSIKDSYVSNPDSTTNYGSQEVARLIAYSSISGENQTGYFMFDTSIPDNTEIINASLSLYSTSGGGGLNLYHIYSGWKSTVDSSELSESGIIWNNQPCGINFDNSTNCNLTGKPISVAESSYSTWDVTDFINNNVGNNISFAIRPTTEEVSIWVTTKEYEPLANVNPYLNITYNITNYENITYTDDNVSMTFNEIDNESIFGVNNFSVPVHQYDYVENLSINISGNLNNGNSSIYEPQIIIYNAYNQTLIDRAFYGNLVGDKIVVDKVFDSNNGTILYLNSTNVSYQDNGDQLIYLYMDKDSDLESLLLNITGYKYGFNYTNNFDNTSDLDSILSDLDMFDSSGSIMLKGTNPQEFIHDDFNDGSFNTTKFNKTDDYTIAPGDYVLSFTVTESDGYANMVNSWTKFGGTYNFNPSIAYLYPNPIYFTLRDSQNITLNISSDYGSSADPGSCDGYSGLNLGDSVIWTSYREQDPDAGQGIGDESESSSANLLFKFNRLSNGNWSVEISGVETSTYYDSYGCGQITGTYNWTNGSWYNDWGRCSDTNGLLNRTFNFTVDYTSTLLLYNKITGTNNECDSSTVTTKINYINNSLYYRDNGTIISNSIFDSSSDISKATIEGFFYSFSGIPDDTDIYYYMSADNGEHWENANDGAEHSFVTQGKNIKYKIEINTTNPGYKKSTPWLDSLNINTSQSYPSNVSLDFGNDGTYDYTSSGYLNDTNGSITANLSSADISGSFTGSPYVGQTWLIPLRVFSSTAGIVTIDAINLTYNPNPVYLNVTSIKEYLKRLTNFGNLNISIGAVNGTLDLTDLRYDYAGGNKTYEIVAHNDDYSINDSINVTYYFSQWDYNWKPTGVEWILFQPNTPTSKNVTPYGQTSSTPILNLTNLGYGTYEDTYGQGYNNTTMITFQDPTPEINESVLNNVTILADISSINSSANISSWVDFENDLLRYYSFDYYSSTQVYDNSSYNKAITFNDGQQVDNFTSGIRGQSLIFDGVDDCLDIPSVTMDPQNLTFSAWYYWDGGTNEEHIITASYQYGIGQVHLRVYDGTVHNFNSGPYLNSNDWNHVVEVSNSTDVYVYVNGNFVGTFGVTLHSLSSSPKIGGYNCGSLYFNNKIDEVMIIGRAIDANEVSALYNSKSNQLRSQFINLSQGSHNFSVYAIDQQGNFNKSYQNFTLVNNIDLFNRSATLSIYMNDTLSCVNTTLSLDSNKTNGTLINNSWVDLTNLSYLETTDIYLWSDYNCNYSNYHLFSPSIYFRQCVVGGVCSTEVV